MCCRAAGEKGEARETDSKQSQTVGLLLAGKRNKRTACMHDLMPGSNYGSFRADLSPVSPPQSENKSDLGPE